MIARSSRWQLQEAKNKLSEVVRRAREEGPQTITVRGEDAVVVARASRAPKKEYRENLWEYFQRSPAAGIEIHFPYLGDVPMRDLPFWFLEEEPGD